MTIEEVFSVDNIENVVKSPIGFGILVVDYDSTCLTIVSKMLHKFGYKVTTARRATDALRILSERQDELDLVLTEVHLPDMDKYELLETMGEMSCLPIVVLSADNNENTMLGCLFKGAMFYLVKPITMNNVKNLWQFSYIKKQKQNVAIGESVRELPPESSSNETSECLSFLDTTELSPQKGKRKELEGIDKDKEEDHASKKPKLIWTNELHNRFLQAIRILGIDGAHPKKILKHMDVPGLKKENISSHLQKYRLSLKREQDAIQKTMLKDYQLSSFSLQTENFQFLKPQFMTASQPEFRNYDQNQKDLDGSLGCVNLPIHVSSNHSDISIPKCTNSSPQNDQVSSTYTSCSVVGISINRNEELGSFGQMENDNVEEYFKDGTAVSNVGNSGFESATDGVEVLGNSLEQLQQFPLPPLSPPPPFLWEQEQDVLFDMATAPTQMFLDEAL